MILNNTVNNNEVKIVGNVQSNRVSIDAKNLDFITQILSTNLYSSPLESFLRETISNAVDAHVEAGVDKPVILDFGKIGSKYYIRIQDFGTGISREKFDTIYKYIGSSTKREDNKYVGCFGLGKFSALAVADSGIITSICDGEKVQYLMYKQGLAIQIDEISSCPTTEHNGVEILIYVTEPQITNIARKFEDIVMPLAYFDKLYITENTGKGLSSEVHHFNNRKIKEFNTFSICTYDYAYASSPQIFSLKQNEAYIRYGNVVYPLDSQKLSLQPKLGWILRNSIGIKIPIGELDVTPNRENLLYSEKTIKAIKDRLEAVNNEIKQILSDKYSGELIPQNISKFLSVMNYYGWSKTAINVTEVWSWPNIELYKIKDDISFYLSVPYPIIKECLKTVTYKGEDIKDILSEILYIFENFNICDTMMIKSSSNKRFSTKTNNGKTFCDIVYSLFPKTKSSYFVKKINYGLWTENIKSATKQHLESVYAKETFVVLRNNFEEFKKSLYEHIKGGLRGPLPEERVATRRKAVKIAVRIIQDFFKEYIKPIVNIEVPKEAKQKQKRESVNYGTSTVMCCYGHGNYLRMTYDLDHYINSSTQLFIYATVDDEIYLQYLESLGSQFFLTEINKHNNTNYEQLYFVRLVKGAKNYVKDVKNFISATDLFSPQNNYWLYRLKEWQTFSGKAHRWRTMFSSLYNHGYTYAFVDEALSKIATFTENAPCNLRGESEEFFQNILSNVPEPSVSLENITGVTKEDIENAEKIHDITPRACMLFIMYSMKIKLNQEETNEALTIKNLIDQHA